MFSFWSGAQEVCLQKGGVNAYIASVYYEHENDFIHEEMMKKNNLPKTRNYWLGGKKNGIGNFSISYIFLHSLGSGWVRGYLQIFANIHVAA